LYAVSILSRIEEWFQDISLKKLIPNITSRLNVLEIRRATLHWAWRLGAQLGRNTEAGKNTDVNRIAKATKSILKPVSQCKIVVVWMFIILYILE
jgi:hypothetical protein